AMAEADPRNLTDAHTEMPSLKGRKAIVTGGTTGIGRAIAILLASEGVKVFVCGRTPEHLEDALERIREVGEGDGINIDLTRQQVVDCCVGEGAAYLGHIDIGVINAGLPADGVGDSDVETIRYIVDTNLTHMMTTTRRVVERMQPGGDILFIGSMSAVSRGPE